MGDPLKILVAKPTICSLPTPGLSRSILCGARSPAFLENLAKAIQPLNVELRSTVQPAEFGPQRIELIAANDYNLAGVAKALGLAYMQVPSAWLIAEHAGSLEDYVSHLSWADKPELNWLREDFSAILLRFIPPQSLGSGLRLSRYRDPVKLRWRYELRDGNASAEVDAQWGRFAVLKAEQKSVVTYSERDRSVSVPRGVPLPPLQSRALALCSGCAAQISETGTVYAHVPRDVYVAVAGQVGQATLEIRR
jgi:hypothetical protein